MPRSRTLLLALIALLVVAVPSAVADDNLGLHASFAAGSRTAVDLAWDTQPDGSQPALVRDGNVPIALDSPTSASDNVADGALHSWTLTVDDGAGTVRSQTVTLDASPAPVDHVQGTATSDEVDLDWTLPPDSDIALVEVSRDTHGCAGPTLVARISPPSSSY